MTGFYFEQKANTSAFKSLFKGNYFVMKQFPRVFSNAVISILTIIVVNVFFGIFTLGTGLLITLPATMLFKAIFELCTYFGVKGERYYLSSTTIVNPLKDTDNNINNMKFN